MNNQNGIPKGAKPFDLMKALNGEKVIDAKGEEVFFCRDYIIEPSSSHLIRNKLNPDGDFARTIYGEIFTRNYNHDSLSELERRWYMAPRNRTVWVNLYCPLDIICTGYKNHESEEAALAILDVHDKSYLKTISVEIPDEE